MRESLRVLGAVLREGDLRRVEVAFAGFQAAEYAVWIAMLVYAYDRGGTTTAAVVAVVQLVPSALFAPIGGALADRYAPGRVLVLGYAAQAAGMAATAAALLADGPPVLAYALSAIPATATTITRPTQAVLLPALARSPDELTAANVVTGWVETAMALAGPAVAGVLLAWGSPGAVFAVFAAVMTVATLVTLPLGRVGVRPGRAEMQATALAELGAGFRALARSPAPRLLVVILALSYVVWGALDVLTVVLAIDVLGLGDQGAGYLVTFFGLGGVAGAAGAAALIGRRRIVPPIVAASVLYGGAFALLGLSSSTAVAFGLLAVAGLGQSLLDVAGRTLLQRIAPPDVLARIFGIHEGLTMVALAVGSILVPPLVALGGAELAFAATGAVLPVFVLLFLRRLLAVDDAARVPIVEISLLRSMPIFAPLTAPALEGIAGNLEPVAVEAGTAVVEEGDRGDHYYAVADGELEVTHGDAVVNRLHRGDGFGEISAAQGRPAHRDRQGRHRRAALRRRS